MLADHVLGPLLAAALPLVTYGTAALLSFSRILERPRAWACGAGRSAPNVVQVFLASLLPCMFCTGMWAGGAYAAVFAATGMTTWERAAALILLTAPAGAASSYLLDLVARRLEVEQ